MGQHESDLSNVGQVVSLLNLIRRGSWGRAAPVPSKTPPVDMPTRAAQKVGSQCFSRLRFNKCI